MFNSSKYSATKYSIQCKSLKQKNDCSNIVNNIEFGKLNVKQKQTKNTKYWLNVKKPARAQP